MATNKDGKCWWSSFPAAFSPSDEWISGIGGGRNRPGSTVDKELRSGEQQDLLSHFTIWSMYWLVRTWFENQHWSRHSSDSGSTSDASGSINSATVGYPSMISPPQTSASVVPANLKFCRSKCSSVVRICESRCDP
uniref:(northern house mosquito) hypothetical protein n=1 Tax=Culex pipiens TaxID=7175 RepID=A0A8D8C1Q6_CULPI